MTKNQSLEKSNQSLAIRDVQSLRVTFDESKFNLLAPVVHMPGGLPPGTRLVVTEVSVDPNPQNKQVFPLPGGMLMPSKVSLDRIANAAGISWLEETRKDDRSHPHYVEMFVRGKMRDFDGTTREITGHKAVDLREDAGGAPGKDYAEIVGKAKNAKNGPRDPSNQLMEARKFIQEIAASKAKNRAIASGLGIKRGYTKAELVKPFVVPKLSMDPTHEVVQHAVVADMIGENAVRAMFGPVPREQKVVEAELEESGVPSSESESAGGTPPPPPVDSDSAEDDGPPPMGGPSPMPTEEQWKKRLGAAYRKGSAVGMTVADWHELIRNVTGKNAENELTFDDLKLIDDAVAEFA